MIRLPIVSFAAAAWCLAAFAESAPEARPDEARVIARARKLKQAGQTAQAEAALERFLEKRPDSAFALTELANWRFEAERYEEAAKLYKRAVSAAPRLAAAHKNLGRALAQLGRYEEAIPALARGVETGGPDADTLGVFAYCCLQTGRPAQAETLYRLARVRRPDRRDFALGLARALFDQQDWPRCEAACLEAIRRRPDDEAAWTQLANARLAAQRDGPALDALLALRYLGSHADWITPLIADLYLRLNLPRQAARFYLAAARRGKLTPRRQAAAGQALLACGQTARARELLKRLLQSRPPAALAARAHLLLGEAAQDAGDAEAAVREFQAALAASPACAAALRRLGDAQLDARRYDEALDAYRLLEAQEGHAAEALRGQADVYLRQRRWTRALDVLYRLNDIAPSAYLTNLIARVERLRAERGNGTR